MMIYLIYMSHNVRKYTVEHMSRSFVHAHMSKGTFPNVAGQCTFTLSNSKLPSKYLVVNVCSKRL